MQGIQILILFSLIDGDPKLLNKTDTVATSYSTPKNTLIFDFLHWKNNDWCSCEENE